MFIRRAPSGVHRTRRKQKPAAIADCVTAQIVFRRVKNNSSYTGTLIAVTSAIARAISAANVYQCIRPPSHQCGTI